MAILFLSSCSHALFAGFSTVLVAAPLVNCYRECGGEGRDYRQLLTCSWDQLELRLPSSLGAGNKFGGGR